MLIYTINIRIDYTSPAPGEAEHESKCPAIILPKPCNMIWNGMTMNRIKTWYNEDKSGFYNSPLNYSIADDPIKYIICSSHTAETYIKSMKTKTPKLFIPQCANYL